MSRRLQRAFDKWLDLEQRGQPPVEADEALRQVFLGLPQIPLPVGFADRVLARLGLAAPAPPSFALRVAVGLCLSLTGLSVVLLPGTLKSVTDLLMAVSWIEVGTSALVGFVQRVAEGFAVWRVVSDVGEILATAFDTRIVLVALSLSVLLSAGAFRMLYGLMIQGRSSRYAGST